MVPKEDVIDASSLYKFRKLRLKNMDLLNLLINKTITLAIEEGIIKSTPVTINTTHTSSRSNPHSTIEILKLRSKQLCKYLYEVDEKTKDIFPVGILMIPRNMN